MYMQKVNIQSTIGTAAWKTNQKLSNSTKPIQGWGILMLYIEINIIWIHSHLQLHLLWQFLLPKPFVLSHAVRSSSAL